MTPEQQTAQQFLKQIQEFDVANLSREDDLGKTLNFAPAVGPAARLVNLFRRIPLESLEEYPTGNVNQIKQLAEQVRILFGSMLAFSVETSPNPGQQRNQLIKQVTDLYDPVWSTLFPYVSYGAARATDFKLLEHKAQEAINSINSANDGLKKQLQADAEESKKLLESIRSVAAEQGVSQQAEYFTQEANRHEAQARRWRYGTITMAVVLGLYAALTMFAHNVPALKPKDNFESSQIITGKVLVFIVLAYLLLLCARNFMAHVHNTIVNRHRRNALLTFNVLTGAANTPASRDIVLTQAAACIYAPQETGYSKSAPQETSLPQAILGLVARTETKP